MGSRRSLSLILFALLVAAPEAVADLGKLDSRARIALAQLEARIPTEHLRESGAAVGSQGSLDVFIRGPVSRRDLEAAGARVRTALPGLYTADVPPEAVKTVAALAGVRRISGSVPLELELDASIPVCGIDELRGPGPAFAGVNGAGVLIGVVDTGADYDHGDFKNAAGRTRFVKIWDQAGSGSPPPPGYNYGAEWSSGQIESGLSNQRDLDGHGTHVLGIAAGDGSQTGFMQAPFAYAGVAPAADLVMVKLPPFDVRSTHIVDGAAYVFDIAASRGQSAAVNLSLGTHFGPHDGTSDFEAGLSALTGPGRIIVKSAGNDRGLARHAEVFAAGAGTDVTLSVTSSVTGVFEIDGYYESTENLSVRLTPPGGTPIGPITRGNRNAGVPGTSTANGLVYLENGVTTTATGDHRVYLRVEVETGQNANGTWRFTFIPAALGPAGGEVDLWIASRYLTTADFQVGRQTLEELISEPGNAVELITVGAFVSKTDWVGCNGVPFSYVDTPEFGNLAPFSSPGPTRDGREKPDITAPGMAIGSTNTRDKDSFCPATPNGAYLLPDSLNHVIMRGTSMAAPHVTGAAALLMQSFGPLTPTEVKNHLFNRATMDGYTGSVWNRDWGRGKLHLDRTTATLLALFLAQVTDEGIELRWKLADPERIASVSLERGDAERGPWVAIDSELRTESGVTIALDRAVEQGRAYYYRLVAFLRSGESVTFGPISATAGTKVERFALGPPVPNPTRGRTRFEFTVPRDSPLRLSVVDVQGREIAVLADGLHRPGRYQVTWSGEGPEGLAAPGLYFVRCRTPEGDLRRRVAVVR